MNQTDREPMGLPQVDLSHVDGKVLLLPLDFSWCILSLNGQPYKLRRTRGGGLVLT